MTARQTICKTAIRYAESALNRRLAVGEKADLLLDTFSWIRDSLEAHAILEAIGEEF